MFYFLWEDAIKILLFSVTSFLTLFIIARLMGKKQLAELNFVDYIIGITIGSIAAEMAMDLTNNPIWYYLIAMFTFLLLDIIISLIERKTHTLKKFFKGQPSTLIYNGEINYSALKKSRITVNDLLSMCRNLGYFDINDIAFAIMEVSGKISILPKGNNKPTTIQDLLKPEITQSKLPCYLVIDGKISPAGLKTINKDEKWLLNKTNCKTKKDLKKFILIEIDTKTEKLKTYRKQ